MKFYCHIPSAKAFEIMILGKYTLLYFSLNPCQILYDKPYSKWKPTITHHLPKGVSL